MTVSSKFKPLYRKRWLEKTELRSRREKALFERLSESLGLGDASAISIAVERRMVFACDDLTTRREADKMGVLLTGTLGILNKSAARKIISGREADRILKEMIMKGFYSPIQSPTRESTDVSPWRDSLFPASGTGAPTPEISRSPGRQSGELQSIRDIGRWGNESFRASSIR